MQNSATKRMGQGTKEAVAAIREVNAVRGTHASYGSLLLSFLHLPHAKTVRGPHSGLLGQRTRARNSSRS